MLYNGILDLPVPGTKAKEGQNDAEVAKKALCHGNTMPSFIIDL